MLLELLFLDLDNLDAQQSRDVALGERLFNSLLHDLQPPKPCSRQEQAPLQILEFLDGPLYALAAIGFVERRLAAGDETDETGRSFILMASEARWVIVALTLPSGLRATRSDGESNTRYAPWDVPRMPKALVLNCLSCRKNETPPRFPFRRNVDRESREP